jgi:uncharacterized protein YgbK (DUF1537 family)
LIYKKTDSTLRGNIAPEFRALLDAFPGRSILYSPAYPALNRTVRGGLLYLSGTPAHLTEFARDPIDPIRTNDLKRLLVDVPAEIVDGETDADVTAAAQALLEHADSRIAAGPAALAGALAAQVRLPRQPAPPPPRLSSCLVINGSLHPASSAQVAYAREHRCLDQRWRVFEEDPGGAGLERAQRLGELVRHYLDATPAEALMVFGGDSALGIHLAMGSPPLTPYRELLPGVPLSHCGNLYWITKAGGFGDAGLICELRRQLT